MRAQLAYGVAALCAGRSRKAVLAEIGKGFALVTLAWFAICLFLALELQP